MKSIDAIYKFGHLYNRETNQRILIEDDAEVSIVLQPEQVLDEDLSIGQKGEPLSTELKAAQLKHKYGTATPYWLFRKSGESLFFKIAGFIPKRTGSEEFLLEFRMKLQEDLYLYNKKEDRPEMAQLSPCKCAILECLTNNFEFFEPVYGDSLNKARTKLHELYFSRVVNPASNAFREFFVDRNFYNKQNSLEALRLKVQEQPPLNPREERNEH